MKVLLAIDESEFSEAAIREVEERFTASGNTVRVIHVVGRFVPPAAAVVEAGGSLKGVRQEVASRYHELVNETADRLRTRGLVAEAVLRDGDGGKVIVREAKDWDADIIVVGSHGHGGLGSSKGIGKRWLRRNVCYSSAPAIRPAASSVNTC